MAIMNIGVALTGQLLAPKIAILIEYFENILKYSFSANIREQIPIDDNFKTFFRE